MNSPDSIAVPSARTHAAFTLLEIATVVVIIGILVVLLLPAIGHLRQDAKKVQCIANLRSLHVAASIYIQQNGHWPQVNTLANKDLPPTEKAKLWVAALQPCGIPPAGWICPTIQELMQNPDYTKPESFRVDYFATSFDDKAITPYQWARQPWFVESGDVHGNGNLIIFTDGSIRSLKEIGAVP